MTIHQNAGNKVAHTQNLILDLCPSVMGLLGGVPYFSTTEIRSPTTDIYKKSKFRLTILLSPWKL